jgi:DNA-binding transcriptional ArsR family regulator
MARTQSHSNRSSKAVEAVFFAMGETSRRQIFFSLMESEKSIKSLAAPLNLTLTGLGQHIKILEAAALVSSRKVGRERICSVNPKGLEVLFDFARFNRTLWASRFAALRVLVEND